MGVMSEGEPMPLRQIIRIDEDKCTGCGQCIIDCAEGALQIVDGKAKLIGELYCDGLGACLGGCPTGALTIEEREADAFDETAVEELLAKHEKAGPMPCGCPGSAMHSFEASSPAAAPTTQLEPSGLSQWPVQLMLIPPGAPFLVGADILVCADCVPFAMPNFHTRYLNGRAVLVGCPKLDDAAHYRQKLEAIFAEAKPKSITVLRMEVPCCCGLSHIVTEARDVAIPECPLEIEVVRIQGGEIQG